MGTRTFNLLVLVFWLAATSWLVVEKVVPHMQRGNPPQYLIPARQQKPREEVVCWTIELVASQRDQPGAGGRLGWAASRIVPRQGGRTEMQSRVQLWRLPIAAMGGPMMRTMLGLARIDDRMEMGINSTIHLDERSQLSRFESSVIIGDGPAWCTITGTNNDGQLEVMARLNKGEPQQVASYWLGDQSVVSDGNAPRGYMPVLTKGQSWKTQQLSPLKAGGSGDVSSEDLVATVMRQEDILWEGHGETCWLVEFRRDSGAGSRWAETPLRQMWVRPSDGMVLREDIQILGRKLKFVRLPADKAIRLAEALEKKWSAHIGEDIIPRHD
ncbi:MAG: hypothetical protein K8T91_25415 [Planctomycetes bacterium]|nr:hypothetical protein [Planctomycetota bacterium]